MKHYDIWLERFAQDVRLEHVELFVNLLEDYEDLLKYRNLNFGHFETEFQMGGKCWIRFELAYWKSEDRMSGEVFFFDDKIMNGKFHEPQFESLKEFRTEIARILVELVRNDDELLNADMEVEINNLVYNLNEASLPMARMFLEERSRISSMSGFETASRTIMRNYDDPKIRDQALSILAEGKEWTLISDLLSCIYAPNIYLANDPEMENIVTGLLNHEYKYIVMNAFVALMRCEYHDCVDWDVAFLRVSPLVPERWRALAGRASETFFNLEVAW